MKRERVVRDEGRALRVLGIADVNLSHSLKWIRYLERRGHHVELVSFIPVTAETRAALPPGVALEEWVIPPFHARRFWITWRALWRLRRLVAERKPDLVHAHFLSYAAWYGALASSMTRTPFVISVMGGGDFTGTRWEPESLREKLLTPYTLRTSKLVLCWSSNLRRLVEPMLGPSGRAEVLVGGVDMNRFEPSVDVAATRRALGLPERDFIVFSPRLMRPLSNIETIVRSFRCVVDAMPDARLVLVRYLEERWPEYARRVDAAVAELGLQRNVIMRPTIENDAMPSYFAAADCTVSLTETDGTPMTLLESLACGTPVVMLDLEDYDTELFAPSDTVLKIGRPDADVLAKALIELGRANGNRKELSARARESIARRASYDAEMGRLESFYREVAAK